MQRTETMRIVCRLITSGRQSAISKTTFCLVAHSLVVLSLLLTACVTTTDGPFTAKTDKVKAASQYVQLGLAYFQQGEYEVAIKKLEKAIEIQPDQHEANAALGLVYQALNESDVAENYFLKALRTDSQYTRGRTYYAAFLYQQQRYEESLTQFKLAAEDVSYPSRAQIFSNIGLVYVRLNKIEEAIEAFQKSHSLRRDQPQVALALATLYFQLANVKNASVYYQDFKASVRARKASHTPQSLRLGIKLARLQQNLNDEASLTLLLRNLYPNSKEYQELKEAD
jgi:type IV pilus assembly protein PilF